MKNSHKIIVGLLMGTACCISGCKKYLDEKSDKKLVTPSSLADLQALLDNTKVNVSFSSAGEISTDDFYLTDADYTALSTEYPQRIYTWQKSNLFVPGVVTVNDWLEGEEEKVQMLKETANATHVTAKSLARMETSAGILALMARLCKIKGLCPDKGQAQIVDHMISTYTSKRVESITRNSFKNLFKKPSVSVARALRRILNAMVAELDFFLTNGRLSDQPEKPTQA